MSFINKLDFFLKWPSKLFNTHHIHLRNGVNTFNLNIYSNRYRRTWKNSLMSEMYIYWNDHFLHERSLLVDREGWTVDKTFKDTEPFIVYDAKIEHLLMSQLWQTGFHSSFDLFKSLCSASSYWNKYNQVITMDKKLMQRWIKPSSFFHFTVEIGHRQ